ncbi:histidine--tRNA ligase [Balamuthia mandrillaris]
MEAPQPEKQEGGAAQEQQQQGDGAKKKKAGMGYRQMKKKQQETGLINVNPIAGARDFPPEEMIYRNWLFGEWREVARIFGFAEYDAPILEYEDLYKRKAGEEITQQMYNFVDKGEQAVALRPEMTPSLARIVLQKDKSLLMPIKWFSIPQCWRFETTSLVRKREHFQWNMDILGVAQVSAEAELLGALVTFFKRVGLTSNDIGIKVSSRKVVQSVLDKLGVKGDKFAKTCVIVDKLDKLEREEVIVQLAALEIPKEIADQIIDSLTVKNLDDLAASLGEKHIAVKELRELFALAEAYGCADWIQFDASVIRGLAYYTGIVFEGFDKTGAVPRAICGGGRYDRLLSTYGAKEDRPACGFGFGDCVIMEILKDRKLLPQLAPKVEDIVLAFNEELRPVAIQVATKLRAKGRSVDIVLGKNKKLKWAYSYADRLGADRVFLVAPDEWKDRLIRIKNLRDGSRNEDEKDTNQENIAFDEL